MDSEGYVVVIGLEAWGPFADMAVAEDYRNYLDPAPNEEVRIVKLHSPG